MPTTFAGIALYVFALFPGLAFTFVREGHRPTARRSALRETAAILVVSVICNAMVALAAIIVSFSVPAVESTIRELLADGSMYVIAHFQIAALWALGILTATTALGCLLGSKWIHELGLKWIWDSAQVSRESSAWNTEFDTGKSTDVVLVGVQLRGGGWIDGVLHSHDNSGDADSTRTITLSGEIHHRPDATSEYRAIGGFGTAVVEAGDIETLFVGKATRDDYYALYPAFNPASSLLD